MSYMTATQTADLGTFMEELQSTLDSYEPAGLDLEIEIKIVKWGQSLGKIIRSTDGIAFVPDGPEFQNYSEPSNPVGE